MNKLHGVEKGEIDYNYHGNDSIHLGNTKTVLFFYDYHTFRYETFKNLILCKPVTCFSSKFSAIWENKECPIVHFSFRTTHHLQRLLQNIFFSCQTREIFSLLIKKV